ncbi:MULTISPECIES: hypothetical protein [unclassified Yoonia]|uniref:hypothetical protein n=1 Tax=unclassified Yoonia TaxID=2629118 RepID=UPI002AFF6952|nr:MULTISPECIES: hypothetical protein [unclassified Yoonia]
MDDFLTTKKIGDGRSLHIASLSRQAIIECEAEHLGFDGFFVFETCDEPGRQGINILGKVASFDAGVQLANLLRALRPRSPSASRT